MSLKLNQIAQFQLTLTPALRLSLEVLQMPMLELQLYLSQQVEENPILEMREETVEPNDPRVESSTHEAPTQELDESFPELWRHADRSSADSMNDELPHRDSPAHPPSLHDHLVIQLRCLDADPALRSLAETLLGWLELDGYLRNPLEEIASSEGVSVEEVKRALELVHRLEPAGVGARNLPECLLVQLAHQHQHQSLAARIVRDHFDLFAKRKTRQLAARLGLSVDEIHSACRILAQLDPRPARNFGVESTLAFLYAPDLIVVRDVNGELQVELNDERLPQIGLSSRYRGLLRNPSVDQDTKLFIRQKMRHAVWLLKAVHQRHETLLAIAKCLVDLERDYFLHGLSRMKALRQETLAQSVGCHASTVSRAIAGKTIQTPYGIVPLSAFFGGGVKHPDRDGTHVSPKTIQAEIAQLIREEDPSQPISDLAIAQTLCSRGFPIARRTVAKYRSAMKLLPAHLRKRSF